MIGTKVNHYVIFASLRVNQLGKLINRIPSFDIKFTRLGFKNATSVLKALPGKLDIKRLSPILYKCALVHQTCLIIVLVAGMTATLRGRPLHGQVMNVPSGYTGRFFLGGEGGV